MKSFGFILVLILSSTMLGCGTAHIFGYARLYRGRVIALGEASVGCGAIRMEHGEETLGSHQPSLIVSLSPIKPPGPAVSLHKGEVIVLADRTWKVVSFSIRKDSKSCLMRRLRR